MASTSKAVVTLLFLSVALCQLAAAESSLTDDIQSAFKEITSLSDNLRVETEKINIFNAPQTGFKIAEGFTVIITTVSQATIAISGESNAKASPLSDDDAKLVVESLTTFVQVHQALLNVVIGKHGLLTLVPFFEPIRIALVQLEAVVDSFAFALIDLIPTQKPAANAQFGSLSTTITAAIGTYSSSLSHGDSLVESIQAAFKEITKLSDNLRVDTQKINVINAPVQGPKIAQGFAGTIAAVTKVNTQLAGGNDGLTPLGDDGAKLVVESLTTFVQVHQASLNVVIGKHGLLTLIPFFEPIRLSLVSLEATVDTFAFYLIGLIPTQKPAADAQFGSLSTTIQYAISTYSTPVTVQMLESVVRAQH